MTSDGKELGVPVAEAEEIAVEKPANAFIVGTCSVEVYEGEYESFDHLLIIKCQSVEQIRKAMKECKIEFTLLGE